MKTFLLFPLFILPLLSIDSGFLPSPPSLASSSSSLNILNLIGDYCQSTGKSDIQCGSGNCESWSTGLKSGGNNPGRLYCNDQGLFCSGSSCYYPCMDKSPNTKILSFEYGQPAPQETIPDAIFTHYVDNYGTQDQTGSYEFSEQVENGYTWSWSSTLSVSETLTIDVGLPDICDIHDSLTISMSTTEGESVSKTTTKGWKTTLNFKVGPNQRIRLDYIVNRVKYVVPFKMTVLNIFLIIIICK